MAQSVLSRLSNASAVHVGRAVLVDAHAALEVRLSIKPASPLAGVRALVELRTYSPLIRADGSCCRLRTADPVGYPFRVEAVSPAGEITRVRVKRARRSLWRGRFAFRRRGDGRCESPTTARHSEHAPGARPRVWVRVRQRSATTPPSAFGPSARPGAHLRRHGTVPAVTSRGRKSSEPRWAAASGSGRRLRFGQTGCWDIHAQTSATTGDIWLDIRS